MIGVGTEGRAGLDATGLGDKEGTLAIKDMIENMVVCGASESCLVVEIEPSVVDDAAGCAVVVAGTRTVCMVAESAKVTSIPQVVAAALMEVTVHTGPQYVLVDDRGRPRKRRING